MIKRCAYCLELKPETNDHIPPKSFFAPPRPSNLITVPCCEACRVTQTQDDEYFRMTIVGSKGVCSQQSVAPIVEKITRSIRNPKQKGFAHLVRNGFTEIDEHSNSGIYLGKQDAFSIDQDRIKRVSERIVRGLYYHEFNEALPKECFVISVPEQGALEEAEKMMEKLGFVERRKIGSEFWYSYAHEPTDKYLSIWVQVYYGVFPFIGFTRP